MNPIALVLHGGGGPATVAALAAHLAERFEVVAPTHPGWNGTPPVPGDTLPALAARYLAALPERGARDVLVVGSSLGGWIAAEMAVQDAARPAAERVLGRLVLIDAVGVRVEGEPIRDFFSLDARGLAEYAWFDAERGYQDPAALPPERVAAMRGNAAALRAYAGTTMHDPSLLGRLGGVAVPALVVWGAADRIVTPAYGRALAAALPDADFVLIERAGHLPHLEQPAETLAAIDAAAR